MDWIDALILGVLQGLTEFLPISSSGHLVLGEEFLNLNVAELKSFDVMVHMGTLMAIFVYFRKDLQGMILAIWQSLTGKFDKEDKYTKLIFYIVIGTLPAVFVGLFLEDWIDATFRNIQAVSLLMVLVGVVFILGEMVHKKVHQKASFKQKFQEGMDVVLDKTLADGYESVEIRGLNWKKALVIGCAQAVAILPGVSRSGSTIVAGLFQGIKREYSARFSFLLAIPAILGAGILTAIKNGGDLTANISAGSLLIGFVSSFGVGLLTISLLMKFLKNHSLRVFALYLILVGLVVYFLNI